jgi:hypothetical protein
VPEPPADEEPTMPQFMLLLHQDFEQARPLTPDEFTTMFKAYAGWADRLRAEGRLRGSQKLADEPGKVMRPTGGRVSITDGPYAETKEVIGGYYIVDAKDYDEACTIAETGPHLGYGGRIEVRRVDEI